MGAAGGRRGGPLAHRAPSNFSPRTCPGAAAPRHHPGKILEDAALGVYVRILFLLAPRGGGDQRESAGGRAQPQGKFFRVGKGTRRDSGTGVWVRLPPRGRKGRSLTPGKAAGSLWPRSPDPRAPPGRALRLPAGMLGGERRKVGPLRGAGCSELLRHVCVAKSTFFPSAVA